MYKHTKLYSVICYITWIGWFAALLLSEKDDRMVRHHLNQALIINIIETAGSLLIRLGGVFAILGEIVDLAVFIFFIMGIVRAFKLSDEPLPLIGDFHLID